MGLSAIFLLGIKAPKGASLQAAESLKAAEEGKERLSAAEKEHTGEVGGLKAEKAALQAMCEQLSGELATARADLQVRMTPPAIYWDKSRSTMRVCAQVLV